VLCQFLLKVGLTGDVTELVTIGSVIIQLFSDLPVTGPSDVAEVLRTNRAARCLTYVELRPRDSLVSATWIVEQRRKRFAFQVRRRRQPAQLRKRWINVDQLG
jgi:hypothetical protein